MTNEHQDWEREAWREYLRQKDLRGAPNITPDEIAAWEFSREELKRLKRVIKILSEGLEVFASCHPIVAARMRAKKLVWHPTGEEYTEIFEEAVHVPDYAQKILAKAEKE
mgnify:CR=1 FL=1